MFVKRFLRQLHSTSGAFVIPLIQTVSSHGFKQRSWAVELIARHSLPQVNMAMADSGLISLVAQFETDTFVNSSRSKDGG